MATASARAQRGIVEECLKWVSQRKAFGKPLASQAVIRSKIAAMIARVESVQSWLENITHQMNNMVRPLWFERHPCRVEEEEIQSYKEQAKYLAGPIALLKMCATQTAQDTARDAVQIFGGRGITRTGMGRFIEHVSGRSCHFTSSRGLTMTQYHRTITFDSLLGGAEDVLGDLGARQALRAMPSNAKL
jgi:alkylation response protein AidB-like acyl-CoA dehydrogenase